MMAVLRQVADPGDTEGAQWAGMRIHRIASEMLTELGASSKVNAEWEFFSLLRDEGRKSAQVFLETHASDLGRRSTLDIDVLLGQDLTNGTVAPATDLAGRHVHAA
jgi:NTE family protein